MQPSKEIFARLHAKPVKAPPSLRRQAIDDDEDEGD
jgi:hypothetical protein